MLIPRGLELWLACEDLKAFHLEPRAILHTPVASSRVEFPAEGAHTQWSGLLALTADAADSIDATYDFVRGIPVFATLPAIETDGGTDGR